MAQRRISSHAGPALAAEPCQRRPRLSSGTCLRSHKSYLRSCPAHWRDTLWPAISTLSPRLALTYLGTHWALRRHPRGGGDLHQVHFGIIGQFVLGGLQSCFFSAMLHPQACNILLSRSLSRSVGWWLAFGAFSSSLIRNTVAMAAFMALSHDRKCQATLPMGK
eukprot:4874369-Amphidinium_carterae.1